MDYHSESWFAEDSESDDDSDDFDPTFVNTRKRYKKLSEMEVCMKRHLDSRGDDSDTEDEVEKALVSPYKRLKLSSLPSDSRLPDLINKQPAKTMKVLQSQGQIKLAVYMNFGLLTVHVIQSRHLSSKWKSLCDSYVKMSLLPDESKRTRCKTQVVYDSNNPLYDEKFSFELLEEDHNKRLLISVWHRDQTSSLSEFLGCMSFGVRHLINPKKETTGWYYLLTEEIGRKKHLQVSKKKQQQQLKVRPHSNIPAINKDIWWMDPMTITVFRGKNGFGFSVIESCPVRIGRVDKASPAEEAGLKKGDCIVRVNGRNVSRSTADSVVKLVKHSRGKLVLDVQRSQEVCIEKMEKSPWRPSSSMTSINDENRAPIPYIDDVSEEWSDNGSQERQLSVDEDIILAEADFPTSTPLPLLCNAAKTVPSAERRKQEAIHRLMSIELDFIDFMYSGIERYSRPLRHCILNPKQHQDLFQNVEKLVTISEYHIKQMQDNAPSCSDTDTTSSQSSMDGTNHFVNSIGLIYQSKIQLLCQAYDIYARGLSNAKKVLTDLKRCQEFRKFIQDSEDPNQPSIMAFIYRAAQHIRELYHVLRDIFENTRPDSHDYHKLKLVVEGLQECVTNITNYSCTRTLNWGSVSSGISSNSAGSLRSSESSSSGSDYSDPRRLIKGPTPSLASYRSCDSKVMKIQERLKFQSNVEVFQLCDEDRRLVYSGEIYEWDGRAWIKLTVFLFTDILLLTECDRHGYYIVIQNPVFLRDIRGIHSEREHKTEFVMHVNSPRNPFSNCRVSFAEKHLFRAPTSELKFTWKSLIEQHIFAVRGSVEHFSSTNSINRSGGTVIV